MRFIVRIPELDSTLYGDDSRRSPGELLQVLRDLRDSGTLLEGGLLADDRGGFLLMEADSCSALDTVLRNAFDPSRYTVESHPILPLENLVALLEEVGTKTAKAKTA
jgi:hypothetical protein